MSKSPAWVTAADGGSGGVSGLGLVAPRTGADGGGGGFRTKKRNGFQETGTASPRWTTLRHFSVETSERQSCFVVGGRSSSTVLAATRKSSGLLGHRHEVWTTALQLVEVLVGINADDGALGAVVDAIGRFVAATDVALAGLAFGLRGLFVADDDHRDIAELTRLGAATAADAVVLDVDLALFVAGDRTHRAWRHAVWRPTMETAVGEEEVLKLLRRLLATGELLAATDETRVAVVKIRAGLHAIPAANTQVHVDDQR